MINALPSSLSPMRMSSSNSIIDVVSSNANSLVGKELASIYILQESPLEGNQVLVLQMVEMTSLSACMSSFVHP